MKSLVFLGLLLLGLVSTASTSKIKFVVANEKFFPENFTSNEKYIFYESQHSIVKIVVPVNFFNFYSTDTLIFFVEADVEDGKTVDKGLYVKNHGVVTKLLDNGRDAAAPRDNSTNAYFAAKDGLYSYNSQENKAVKYGNVNDDLVGIEVGDMSRGIYVLTADKTVYKVTEDGNKKVKIDDIKNPVQIVLDISNNLFYVDSEKKVFVVNTDGVKQIQGLPENPAQITLIRPLFVLEAGVPVMVDRQAYIIMPNGTSRNPGIKTDVDITACSVEAGLVQYYAHNKTIYEFNVLNSVYGPLHDMMTKNDRIQRNSTRSRSEFIPNNV